MSTRRSEARERAAQLHRQQEAAARRRRVTTVTSVVVVGLLVVLGLGVLVLRDGGGGTVVDAQAPAGLVDGAIVSGQAAAPVTLTLYEDLQCPGCKAFEAASGDTIDELVASGDVRVETRPLAFLDRQSSTDYSSRALNALACVQDVSPDAVAWPTRRRCTSSSPRKARPACRTSSSSCSRTTPGRPTSPAASRPAPSRTGSSRPPRPTSRPSPARRPSWSTGKSSTTPPRTG